MECNANAYKKWTFESPRYTSFINIISGGIDFVADKKSVLYYKYVLNRIIKKNSLNKNKLNFYRLPLINFIVKRKSRTPLEIRY